jgi:hypothetical protein
MGGRAKKDLTKVGTKELSVGGRVKFSVLVVRGEIDACIRIEAVQERAPFFLQGGKGRLIIGMGSMSSIFSWPALSFLSTFLAPSTTQY